MYKTGAAHLVRVRRAGFFAFQRFCSRRIIFARLAAFSSSDIVGSLVNFSQGRAAHPPQSGKLFPFTQQSYTAHTACPVYSSQYTRPSISRQPAHSEGYFAHSPHAAPQGAGASAQLKAVRFLCAS